MASHEQVVVNVASGFAAGWAVVHLGRQLKIKHFSLYDDVREQKCPVNGMLSAAYAFTLAQRLRGGADGENVQSFATAGLLSFSWALYGQYRFCSCKLSLKTFDTWSKVLPLMGCAYLLAHHLPTFESPP
eukprot:CAMPEP_0175966142 /NCGR_PEP_ID=MMETSP0108-20121206/38508_1 /TAXON_ID=195067 ORGANISM="Goniomonas pacifica, Strain CCMP1869" /NCGR_SAMPLE_ID=MMETSP0108 /ASSEMBLY_ACC=CAM_ASM_000204 /LENGTH=129 /DNA_ID=CAMNT_0017294313 /DNA_START=6 /DNA_END=395 /DNA_ORIENTATION=+